MTSAPSTELAWVEGADPLYFEATQLLAAEATTLDRRQYRSWLEMLDPDLEYRAPVPSTRERLAGPAYSADMAHFDENLSSMEIRVRRLETDKAWAEDPASRTRHIVTNVRAGRAGDNEIGVESYLLLLRTRGDWHTPQMVSCERHDRWRRGPDRWRLRRRDIYLDQTLLGFDNLAVFL